MDNLLDEFTCRKERKLIQDELNQWFKNPYLLVICDFKNRYFTKKYGLRKDKKFAKYIDWYN